MVRGRGRGQSSRHTLHQQSRESDIANWVHEAQLENFADQIGNDDINIPAPTTTSSPVETILSATTSTGPSSSSSPSPRGTLVEDLRPTLPFMHRRGRGRARGIIQGNDVSPLGSSNEVSRTPPVPEEGTLEGSLRSVEDVLPSVTDVEDSFIAKFRNLGPTAHGLGTRVPRISLAKETLIKQEVSSSSSPPLSLKSTSETTSSASPSSDFAHSEKSAIVKKGTKGTKITISTNYIRLHVDKNKGYFEYHVDFEPILDSIRFKKKLVFEHQDVLGKVRNFDGSTLFLPIKLANKLTILQSKHPVNPDQEVKLIIKYVKQHSFSSSTQFYNVLFRRIMNILGMIQMGRNHYDYQKTFQLPQHRLEIFPGYVTAIEEYEDGLMLCCDASFRVLRTSTILDVLERIRNTCPNNYREVFENTVLNKIVLTRHNNKTYRVDDVEWEQTPIDTFNKNGTQISFMQYFEEHHKIMIKDRSQPLLVSRPKLRFPRHGEGENLICLIPELCYETGLSTEITSEYIIMKDISRFTRLTPAQRLLSLRTFVKSIQDNQEASDILSQWGLEIDDATVSLDARVVNPPNLEINSRLMMKPAKHEFDREITKNHIMKPIPVSHWLVLCVPSDVEKANRFVLQYRQVTPSLGIEVASDARVLTIPGRGNVDDFKRIISMYSHGVQFLVIILPNSRGDIYTATKQQTLVDKAIPTQMILSRTLSSEKKMRAIVVKIALQINCKLGGYLWSLRIPLNEKIMFVGMDVYHDPKTKSPSCMALVATMNGQHTKCFSRVIFQKPHQEITDSVKTAFIQSLQAFFEENNGYPDRVVVFRDGVGDGQLELTKEHEIVQFKSAMDYVIGSQPKFTFTVVQKRINTRIFAETENKLYENPPPGTVLDHSVTRKYLFDFFLVSQYVREGTVTPSHFIVLEDNSDISPDLIQKFAFASSFMYYNWAGTIRVPSVCQYAHKLAFLVGQHLKLEPSESLSKQFYYL